MEWEELIAAAPRIRRGGRIDRPSDVEDVVAAARGKGLDGVQAELVGSLVRRLREAHYSYRTEQT